MDQGKQFRFVAEKAYSIPGRGTVVSGRVERGSVAVGDEIGFLGTEGKYIAGQVMAIEVARRLVETAESGTQASLLLQGVKKGQITVGAVLTAVPESPSGAAAPSAPAPYDATVYQSPSPPTTSPHASRPIHPPSSSFRLIFLIVIGVLLLLLLIAYQGKWDPRKLDPKKWDPRRKVTAIENMHEVRYKVHGLRPTVNTDFVFPCTVQLEP